jgi:hypothetical protein
MSLPTGTSLGVYEIVASLGVGGMGEVYRARDTRLGRDVALKILPLSRHDDLESRARFEREARTLAALNHPRIAAIHDLIDVGDRRAMVMELVEGPTLAQVMAAGPVPLQTAIGYAIDISEALSIAHAAGIGASGSEARQRRADLVRIRQGAGFWHRQGVCGGCGTSQRADHDRCPHRGAGRNWNSRVPVTGAGTWSLRRRPQRYLQPGCPAARDDLGQSRVSG